LAQGIGPLKFQVWDAWKPQLTSYLWNFSGVKLYYSFWGGGHSNYSPTDSRLYFWGPHREKRFCEAMFETRFSLLGTQYFGNPLFGDLGARFNTGIPILRKYPGELISARIVGAPEEFPPG